MPQLVPPERWKLSLPLYAAAGAVLALSDPLVQPWLQRHGIRPGMATMVHINILLPAVTVALAILYPKMWTALVGALLATTALVLTHMLQREWHFWLWTWPTIARSIHPIHVAATIGYAVIGIGVVGALSPVRKVGREEPGPRCAACGYSMIGLEDGPCPECGATRSAGDQT